MGELSSTKQVTLFNFRNRHEITGLFESVEKVEKVEEGLVSTLSRLSKQVISCTLFKKNKHPSEGISYLRTGEREP